MKLEELNIYYNKNKKSALFRTWKLKTNRSFIFFQKEETLIRMTRPSQNKIKNQHKKKLENNS
jgi:hypothetical protein